MLGFNTKNWAKLFEIFSVIRSMVNCYYLSNVTFAVNETELYRIWKLKSTFGETYIKSTMMMVNRPDTMRKTSPRKMLTVAPNTARYIDKPPMPLITLRELRLACRAPVQNTHSTSIIDLV